MHEETRNDIRQAIVDQRARWNDANGEVVTLATAMMIAAAEQLLDESERKLPTGYGRVALMGHHVVVGAVEALPGRGYRVRYKDEEGSERVVDAYALHSVEWMTAEEFAEHEKRRMVHRGPSGYQVHRRDIDDVADEDDEEGWGDDREETWGVRLDFAGWPPSWPDAKETVSGDAEPIRLAAWERYRREHDPPALTVRNLAHIGGEPCFAVQVFDHPCDGPEPDGEGRPGDDFATAAEARAAAWAWYERRLNLLKALERNARHPIAASVPVDGPLWPEILEWSDMRVAEHEEAVGAALDNRCTGMTAIWCPRCGDCKCPLNEAGERSLDGSACPLHAPDSAHGEPAGLVRARHPLGDRDRAPPTLLRQLLTDARSNLEGWAEPNGYLVPSEPDLEERARIRISLRGLITGYMIALGEEPPRSQFEKDDLRDRLRIAEAAVADQEAAARG